MTVPWDGFEKDGDLEKKPDGIAYQNDQVSAAIPSSEPDRDRAKPRSNHAHRAALA